MAKHKHTGGSCLPPGVPDVSVTVSRVAYGPDAVLGIATVVNNHNNEFKSAITMENSRAGEQHDKPPIPTGLYGGFVDPAHGALARRIEFTHVPGYEHIEMHNGNHPSNSEGCVLVGSDLSTARDPHNGGKPSPFLASSKPTLKQIMSVSESAVPRPVISVEVRNMFDAYGSCQLSPEQPTSPSVTPGASNAACYVGKK